MKQYVCHKVVEAGKIAGIEPDVNTVDLHLSDNTFTRVTLPWFQQHNPVIGGYLVRYKDGYLSYSPAVAFEEGYTEITPP